MTPSPPRSERGEPVAPGAAPVRRANDAAGQPVDQAVDEVIAFYLPQFHPTAENDEFWGPGFTEWTNVTAARPLYRGHRQPLLPADLGFYDLRVPEVRAAQAELARAHGVTAFCYWHYWFAGRRVLDQVVDEVVRSGEPDFPFCLGWANQSWTGIWHGAADRILIEQTYPGADDHRRHFDALATAFADPRYLRVDGRPVFYVQDPSAIPDVERWVLLWQQLAEDAGLGELFLVGEYRGGPWEPQHFGFDGSVAVRLPAAGAKHRLGLGPSRGPTVVPYAQVHERLTSLEDDEHFPCVVPRWDNTPRSGRRGLVLDGSTPSLFRAHVASVVAKAMRGAPGRRLVWVKSWNEWAEGNTLEPDSQFALGYLEALRDGLTPPRTPGVPLHVGADGVVAREPRPSDALPTGADQGERRPPARLDGAASSRAGRVVHRLRTRPSYGRSHHADPLGRLRDRARLL